jgi:cysteinyl-tRNA synthetase
MRKKFVAAFEEAMDDDFNTAKALAAFFDLVRSLNKILDSPDAWKCRPEEILSVIEDIQKLGTVLGLFQQDESQADSTLSEKLLDMLITLRAEARVRKDYALADSIRDRLAELGIALEDTPDGTFWREKEIS